MRETFEDWQTLGRDLISRGLGTMLIVADGAPGLIKAIEQCWPASDRQRCSVHRVRNLSSRSIRAASDSSRFRLTVTTSTAASPRRTRWARLRSAAPASGRGSQGHRSGTRMGRATSPHAQPRRALREPQPLQGTRKGFLLGSGWLRRYRCGARWGGHPGRCVWPTTDDTVPRTGYEFI
jgi:hypothetical protein